MRTQVRIILMVIFDKDASVKQGGKNVQIPLGWFSASTGAEAKGDCDIN